MSELFLIRDNLANKISYYHLMLFLLSLPFDRFYSHVILASFGIHTLIHFNRAAVKPIFTWRSVALQSVFLVTAVSTFYASNKPLAFNDWGLDVSIFLMPVLLCINAINLKKYGSQLLLVFALGNAATILYLYFNAVLTIRFYKLPASTLFSPAFTNHNFAQPIDMHATFFSLQIAVALVYILSELIKQRVRSYKLFYGAIGLILLSGIIQLSSKSVFAVLLLTINIALPIFLLNGARRKQFIIASASVTAVIIAGIFSFGTFRNRYLNELRDDFSAPKPGQTIETRLVRWKLAATLVTASPLTGYGAGSEIPLLQEKYFDHKYYNSYLHRLNAHNEYLSFLIKSGVWGLAVYLATLVYGFRKAVQKKDIVFFGFIMLLAIVSLSENILDVDKGVMFYSFFFPFFVFIADSREKQSFTAEGHKYSGKATNCRPEPSLI